MASVMGEFHIGVEQPISAEIFFEQRGLRAETLNGAVHRIHYRDVVVDADPDGTVIARSTRDESAMSSRDEAFLPALKKHGIKLDDHVLASMAEGRGRKKGLVWFAALMGISLAVILLVMSLPYVAVLLVDFLPRSVDQQLGDATGAQVQLGAELTDPTFSSSLVLMA